MTEGPSDPPFASALLYEYLALTNVLDHDVVASRSALLEADSQFKRRQFVRAVTADIEATVGSMIRVALGVHHLGEDPFSPDEYALLQKQVLELRESGASSETRARLITRTNIRFAFSVFTRAMQTTYSLPSEDATEWAPLMQAFAIRDRIALPRVAAELDIADDELRAVHEADVWFDHRCGDAIRGTRYKAQPERSA